VTKIRAVELLTEALILAYSAGFLAWYLWAKLSSLPPGTWPH
jgi:hypothetical protein